MVATRMILLIGVAGSLVLVLVIALACWTIVRRARKKRARLSREGDHNAMRMGNYVESTESAIRLRAKGPDC